jgi:purine-binding chemotaxis protein CheW
MAKQEGNIPTPGQYLTFKLRDQIYGVGIASVREINRAMDITEVPRTPTFVAGVINLRGKVIPVVDLRMKFGMAKTQFAKETCIIVLDADSGQIGVIVDAVNAVITLHAEQLQAPPIMGDDEDLDFVLGMGKVEDHVIILVDVVKTLGGEAFKLELAMQSQAA